MLREVIKLLLEQQKEELQEMAARTISDLPDGWKLHAFPFSATSWEFILKDEQSRRVGMIRILYWTKCYLWEVANSFAIQGWGPFMYDIAMEFASGYTPKGMNTLSAGGLMSDRTTPSDEANAVWKFYYDNRPDVTKHFMDEYPYANCANEDEEDEQHLVYYSKQPSILPRLEAEGKLVIER